MWVYGIMASHVVYHVGDKDCYYDFTSAVDITKDIMRYSNSLWENTSFLIIILIKLNQKLNRFF